MLGVFTGADCAADGLGAIRHDPLPKTRDDMKLTGPGGGEVFIGPHLLLPADKVRHVGEAVAMVVAETKAQALDAAEALEVVYDELPFVLHSEDAMQAGAPAVWDEVPDNILVDTQFRRRRGDRPRLCASRECRRHGFQYRPRHRRSARSCAPASPITMRQAAATRCTPAAAAPCGRSANSPASSASSPTPCACLSFDVGGNFGTRNRVYPEYGLVLWASRKLGRPVKFLATRSECFISDYQGRDLVAKLELALDAKGRFLALRATNISNAGARCVSLSPLSKGAGLITGNYAIPAASLRAVSVFTNTIPTQAYRSSGRPEVTFAIERLIDIAAAKLAIDRISLRRRNLVRPKAMPYRNAVGMTYDSGRYEENMDLAMRIADWDGFKARRREAKKRGQSARPRARQLRRSPRSARPRNRRASPSSRTASTSSSARSRPGKATRPVSRKSCRICCRCRSSASASSWATPTWCAPAAARIPAVPCAMPPPCSRSPRPMLIAKGKRIAALALGTTPERVEFNDGRFAARETNRSFDFLELAQEIPKLTLPDDLAGGLAVVADNEMHDPVFPNGCAICEIEIDPDSGGLDAHALCLASTTSAAASIRSSSTARPMAPSRRASARRCGSNSWSTPVPASRSPAR